MLKYCAVVLFILCGKLFAQNPLIDSACMKFLSGPAPVITISNTDPLICEGELTLFTSQSSYGNAVPSYNWTVNGNTVGTDSPEYATTTLTNGSHIVCKLTVSTPSCPDTSRVTTSELTIYVYPLIHPAITITPTDTDICRGEQVTFKATANGGTAPSFAWEINHKPVGEKAPALITSSLQDGDTVSCTITIDQDSRCHSGTSASSNKVVIHVRDFTDPTVTIAATMLNVCPGAAVAFTATGQNAGEYKFYQWHINGQDAGTNSTSFIHNQFASGDQVSCTLSTTIPGCPITADVASNVEVVTVKDAPVITFSPPEISILSGEQAQLNASVSTGFSSFAWQPEGALVTPQSLMPLTLPLLNDTSFKLTVRDINGCTTSNELVVKVLHKLYMPSAFTPNQDGKNDVFRIPPDASVTVYEFSVFDRWGNAIFKTVDVTKGWNGTYKGQNLDTGTYIYLIKGSIEGKEATIKGTVILIR